MMVSYRGMLWNQLEVDYYALATALLPEMKEQSRVDHSRDDNTIRRHTAWAIATVEKRANISLNPATYRSAGYSLAAFFGPCACPLPGALGYPLPFNNVRALRLFDIDGNDVTKDWGVVQARFGSNAEAYAVSPSNAGPPNASAIEIDVGVDDVTELDPSVVQAIERFAASAYENREADSPLGSDGFDAEVFAIWRPAV